MVVPDRDWDHMYRIKVIYDTHNRDWAMPAKVYSFYAAKSEGKPVSQLATAVSITDHRQGKMSTFSFDEHDT